MTTAPLSKRLHLLHMRTAFYCATAVAGVATLLSPSPAQAGWGGASAQQDTILRPIDPANCVTIGDDDLRRLKPLEDLLTRMANLPLTGTELAAMVRDPAQKQRACTTSQDLGDIRGLHVHELRTTALHAERANEEVALHELFHSGQGMRGAILTAGAPVSRQDMAFSYLLTEATARVYPFLAAAEAQMQQGVLPIIRDNKKSDAPAFQRVLSLALVQAYEAASGMEEGARRAHALQQAGIASVDFILSGGEAGWSRAYVPEALKVSTLVNPNAKTEGRRYRSQRDELFTHAGYVGAQINITPTRFLGNTADAEIGGALKANGLEIIRVPKPAFQFRPVR